MKQKQVIWIGMLILLALGVLAANPHTVQTSSGGLTIEYPKELYFAAYKGDIDFYFHVFNSTNQVMTAPTTNCTVHIYNTTNSHMMASLASMDANGIDYEVVLSDNITLFPGVYPYVIQCSNVKEAGFVSDFFEIAHSSPMDTTAGMPMAMIILLPLLFGILLLIGSFMFGEEHAVLKIGLFMLSYLTIFISLWFSIQVVVRYYGFTDLQDAIGLTTMIAGVMFFVIVSYFMIYAFIKGTEAAAQQKRKELEY